MRSILALLLLCSATTAHAREWKSEIFHCSANIPDGTGWQMIEAPASPGIAPVLTMQHATKQAVFGISVIEKYHEANLADPAIQKDLEAMLRQFGYQFVGHSTVKTGGLDWLQYPVRAGAGAQQVSGIIRYASAGGYVFGITMLRGGGQQASQDAELQQAAASFRMLPTSTVAAATLAPAANAKGIAQAVPAPTPAATGGDKSTGATETPEEGADESRTRMLWYAGGGIVALLVLFGIIGGKGEKTR